MSINRFMASAAIPLCLAACQAGSGAVGYQQPAPPIYAQAGSGQLNAIRAAVNLPAVSRNARLDAVARGHAQDMATNNFFSHKGSNGSSLGDRATRGGYSWCRVAENISKGFSSEAGAIESWKTSPDHYTNMTKRKVKEYGLANVGDIWVMVLAARSC